MGATTLYHPVSLMVIRAVAIHCGWRFGRIVQTSSDPANNRANYTVEITHGPGKHLGKPADEILKIIQACFVEDVRCHWVRLTKNGRLYVDLHVDINKPKPNGRDK